jgi:hypothetical protein
MAPPPGLREDGGGNRKKEPAMRAYVPRYLLAGAVAWAIMEPFAIGACHVLPPVAYRLCGELDGFTSMFVAAIAFVIFPLAYLPWFFLRKWLIGRRARPILLSLAYPALALAAFAWFFVQGYPSLGIGEAASDFTNKAYVDFYFDLWSANWPSIFACLCFFVIMDSES